MGLPPGQPLAASDLDQLEARLARVHQDLLLAEAALDELRRTSGRRTIRFAAETLASLLSIGTASTNGALSMLLFVASLVFLILDIVDYVAAVDEQRRLTESVDRLRRERDEIHDALRALDR